MFMLVLTNSVAVEPIVWVTLITKATIEHAHKSVPSMSDPYSLPYDGKY